MVRKLFIMENVSKELNTKPREDFNMFATIATLILVLSFILSTFYVLIVSAQ